MTQKNNKTLFFTSFAMVVLFQSFNPPSDFPFVGLRVYLPQKAAGWWVVGLNGKYVNTELSRVEHGPRPGVPGDSEQCEADS